MINVNMTDKAGVTLATAGKYCADNVKVTPSADILRKDEQAKTATPTTSTQDITPDAGKALSKVTVNPITAAIVGDLDADSFASAIVAAIEGKGVTVPEGTLLDGLAGLIESIQAGGGGIELPTGYKVSTGSYTPSTEGTNVLHEIKIASSVPYNLPCRMFCIYREDGFDASGSAGARYLTFYAGAISNSATSSIGSYIYRNTENGTFTGGGGVETNNSANYGLPTTHSANRTNCFVRSIISDGCLTFSTYGIITLESGKTYKWFALLPSDAEV